MNEEVKMIPIEKIRILNPRQRDKKKFEVIVQSIRKQGLKKPIQVSLRAADENEGEGYDLVCGQGRVEAFLTLGFKEIPAIVVQISKEDRLLRSLVENMARRLPSPMELIDEIQRLKAQGYNQSEIARKLDITREIIIGLTALKKAGEERLLDAALTGKIPLGVAMDIAKTDGVENQRALLKAYEEKEYNQAQIRDIKRYMDQRRFLGKKRGSGGEGSRKNRPSAENMIKVYKRESEKRKGLVRKAHHCEEQLVFVVGAFGKLMADEHFITLLRAESLATMPKVLAERVTKQQKEGI